MRINGLKSRAACFFVLSASLIGWAVAASAGSMTLTKDFLLGTWRQVGQGECGDSQDLGFRKNGKAVTMDEQFSYQVLPGNKLRFSGGNVQTIRIVDTNRYIAVTPRPSVTMRRCGAISNSGASPAMKRSWSASEQSLITNWERLNELCRGGAGSADATDRACAQRDTAGRRLNQQGICYGKKTDQAAPDARMHRCGPDSEHFG